MYQQQQLQSQSQHLSSRTSLPPEKHFLLQGGNDSGLVLSTDAKPRLKWTADLHERFVEAVNQLGGPDKATPKTIMRAMGIPGLTLYHLKSHLQKYRLSKNLQAQSNAVNAKNVLGSATATNKPYDGHGSPAGHFNLETQASKPMHINEALQMQIEVQRRLHDQLEVQRHLQLRIEAQGKYLQSVLEKAQEALANQTDAAGNIGVGVAKAKLPELASGASSKRQLRHEHSDVPHQQLGDGSVDSCLTACEPPGSRARDGSLSIGRLSSAEAAARSGAPAPSETASTSREEEYYVFLDKPSSSRASSDEQHQLGRRLEITGDGFDVGMATALGMAELDLNINVANSRERRNRDRIDLNGSAWN